LVVAEALALVAQVMGGGGGPSFDLIVGVAVVAWCWVYYLWNWRRLRMIGSGVMIGLVLGRRFGAAILV
jgi:hypothetical protein